MGVKWSHRSQFNGIRLLAAFELNRQRCYFSRVPVSRLSRYTRFQSSVSISLPRRSVLWISRYTSVEQRLLPSCIACSIHEGSLPPLETFSLRTLFVNCLTAVVPSLRPLRIAASLSIYPHIYRYIYRYIVSMDQNGFKIADILKDEASFLCDCSPIKNKPKRPTGSKSRLAELAKRGKGSAHCII